MNKLTQTLAGVLSVTLATTGMMALPAQAEEWKLSAADKATVTGTSMITTGPADPSAPDAPIWKELSLAPLADAEDVMAAGRTREFLSLSHMVLGGATLGFLGLAGISGIMLIPTNDPTVRLLHQIGVGVGTAAYVADGSLMLFAPRPHKTKGEEAFSNITAHRYLFYLHLLGMTSAVATGLIATRVWSVDPSQDIRRTHPAVGAGAIGVIGLSALVMAMNF